MQHRFSKLSALLAIIFAIVCIGSVFPSNYFSASASTTNLTDTNLQTYADQLITLVNQERANEGLKPLYAVPVMNEVAAIRADECIVQATHTRLNNTPFYSLLNTYNIGYYSCGENIAIGLASPEEAFQVLMQSDEHRSNLQNEKYEYTGVGIAYENGTYYWTQIFTGGVTQNDGYLPAGTTDGTTTSTTTMPASQTTTSSEVTNTTTTVTTTNPAHYFYLTDLTLHANDVLTVTLTSAANVYFVSSIYPSSESITTTKAFQTDSNGVKTISYTAEKDMDAVTIYVYCNDSIRLSTYSIKTQAASTTAATVSTTTTTTAIASATVSSADTAAQHSEYVAVNATIPEGGTLELQLKGNANAAVAVDLQYRTGSSNRVQTHKSSFNILDSGEIPYFWTFSTEITLTGFWVYSENGANVTVTDYHITASSPETTSATTTITGATTTTTTEPLLPENCDVVAQIGTIQISEEELIANNYMVSVPITFSKNTGLQNIKLGISWNPNMMALQGAKSASSLVFNSANALTGDSAWLAGIFVKTNVYNTFLNYTDSDFCILTFHLNPSVKSGDILPIRPQFMGANGKPASATDSNGGPLAFTAEAGNIVIASSSTPAASEYGDINSDGRVDLSDAILLNKAIAGTVQLSDCMWSNADCMKDNILNEYDALTLLRFLVHFLDELPQYNS